MAKKKKFKPRHCSGCSHAIYIGEGDFICDKHSHQPDRAIVIADWAPTSNYLQCLNGRGGV